MSLPGFVGYKKEDAEKYRRLRWWSGLTLGDLLDKAADVYPDKEAVVDNTQRLTYAELREKANKLAIGLINLGIKKQDRILVQLPNWAEFVYTYFAIQKIGAIVVMLIARYAETELNHICKLANATAWVVPQQHQKISYAPIIDNVLKQNPQLKYVILVRSMESTPKFPQLEELIESADLNEENLSQLAQRRPNPDEVAHMGPTGGTTGLPKIVPHTHNTFVCRSEYVARAWELCPHDVTLIATPIGHDLSIGIGVCPTIFMQGKVVMLDSTFPEDVLDTIQKERVTAIPSVPSLIMRVVDFDGVKNYDVSSLEKIYCGGQASPAQLVKDVIEKLGCKYINAYGGTEGQETLTRLNYDQSMVHTTVGKKVCPYDIYKIIDANEKELPINTAGELVIKGPCVFSGYFNNPAENTKVFTKDGFFKTGDLATIDEAGDIRLAGRIRDAIKRGGESISPVQIEQLMITHPSVHQVSVVGMPDKDLGERICAYVQLNPGKTLAFGELITFLKQKGASVLLLPERLEFIDAMPLTEAGKPDKKPLREDIRRKLVAEGKIPPQ